MPSYFNMIGAGEWGLSVANHLSNLGNHVNVYIRNHENLNVAKQAYQNSENIIFYDLTQLAENNNHKYLNIIAVSSSGFPSIIDDYKSHFEKSKYLCWLTKGLDHNSGLLFHDLVDNIINTKLEKCIISGPSFARDLEAKKDIQVSIASTSIELSKTLLSSMSTNYFKMIPTTNIIGVEVAGVIKNITAILAGALTANNFKQSDIDKLIKKAQNDIQIMSNKILENRDDSLVTKEDLVNIIDSPSCLGDLKLTCLQDISRNRQLGLKITPGIDIRKTLSDIGTVEGYMSTFTLHNNQSYFGYSSIVDSAYKILYLNSEPKTILEKLLN